jgi:hypothetical protein
VTFLSIIELSEGPKNDESAQSACEHSGSVALLRRLLAASA